ncbi:MAG TPA: CopD family protein [Rhodanobacteraceae bacterium]|nr:CopD family protein [Rhodanobacteraceae bacterium]
MATTRLDISLSRSNKGPATPVSIALSAFDIATLIAVIGMLACRLAVLPRDADAVLARSLHRVLCGALALLTFASLGILLSRTLEMNGSNWHALSTDVRLALSVTHFGHVWLRRVPALVIAWAAWAWALRHRDSWPAWLMVIAIATIALTRSETGHPADHGDFTIAVWIDWLHILAAGMWVGSLFGMTLAVFPRLLREGKGSPGHAAILFRRLSTLSGIALALLVACGIFNAIQQLGSFEALWTSRYGINLDVKLGIVLAMVAIGAHNRYVKLPRLLACTGQPAKRPLALRWLPERASVPLARDSGQILRSCARAVLIESLLGITVIGATAALIHATPPADVPHVHTVRTKA